MINILLYTFSIHQMEKKQDAELLVSLRQKNQSLAAQNADLQAQNTVVSAQLGKNALLVDNVRRTRAAVLCTSLLRQHQLACMRVALTRWRNKFGMDA